MRVALLLMTLSLFSTPLPSGAAPAATTPTAAGSNTPVLLELFTSEGCSSCPPADRLLATLDQSQPIPGATLIVLSEHVDYWNQLGWADPFSAAAYSQRQHDYATRLHLDSVYTPQIVVDGRVQAVGNDPQEVRAAIDKAAKSAKTPVTVALQRRGEPSRVTVVVDVPALPAAGTVYVALASDQERSQVQRGENSGKSLGHVAVVHKLTAIGHTGKKAAAFHQEYALDVPATGDPHRWRVVTFVQSDRTGEILGVQQEHL